MLQNKREKIEARRADKGIPEAKRAVKLTPKEEQDAKAIAGQQFIGHRNLLQEIKFILHNRAFELQLAARLVMRVAKEHPKMLWSLKALFHRVAQSKLKADTWSVERELCRQATYHVPEPLDELRKM